MRKPQPPRIWNDEERSRFWAKTVVTETGCREWIGKRAKNGYGLWSVHANEGERGSHRVAYELTYGPIPVGMLACHRCDNPPCCEPTHLFLGTYSDNAKDAIDKGLWGARRENANPQRGDDHWSHRHPEKVMRGTANANLGRRKGVCKRGHLRSGDNLLTWADKHGVEHRYCRACRLTTDRRHT